MTTLNELMELRSSVPAEVQQELYSLFASDPDAAMHPIVDISADQGVTLTEEEVKGFLLEMDDEEEFDDIELDAVALAAIAGGRNGGKRLA